MNNVLKYLSVMSLLATVAAENSACGQALFYHHRSTAAGDYFSGCAEIIVAQGIYLRNLAAAERDRIEANILAENAHLECTERRLRLERFEQDEKRQKAEVRQRNPQVRTKADRVARGLSRGESNDHPGSTWPQALQGAEFTASRNLIDGILANWNPVDSTAFESDPFRLALATEVGILRKKIGGSKAISAHQRAEAIAMLCDLHHIAAAGNGPNRSNASGREAILLSQKATSHSAWRAPDANERP